MTRLVHSHKGLIRATQISKSQLIIYTEGGLDRPFCEKLIKYAFPDTPWAFTVIAAKELSNETGGKPELIKLFKTLRAKKKLNFTFQEKKQVALFFADKDIDDILGKKFRSKNFIYTKTYDIEGQLLGSGDLVDAISSSCQVTTDQARSWIGAQKAWIDGICTKWSDWTALYIICQVHSINVGCGYSRPSTINGENALQETDIEKLNEFLIKISEKMNLPLDEVNVIFNQYKKKIADTIKSGNGLRLFKGKWLAKILQDQVKKGVKVADASLDSTGSKALSVIVSHVGRGNACPSCNSYLPSIKNACAYLH